jgi:hypothetical protein
MTQIYPAAGQLIADVINELEALGLRNGPDFQLHYAWDARPYIQATPQAYDTWAGTGDLDPVAEEPADPEQPPADPEPPVEPEPAPTPETDAAPKPKTASKRGGK